MLAVHLENGAVSLREVSLPERREGYALLRLLAGGVCNTDLELLRGYYGFAGTNSLRRLWQRTLPRWKGSAWWAKSTWLARIASGAAKG